MGGVVFQSNQGVMRVKVGAFEGRGARVVVVINGVGWCQGGGQGVRGDGTCSVCREPVPWQPEEREEEVRSGSRPAGDAEERKERKERKEGEEGRRGRKERTGRRGERGEKG
eukprot:748463-Hanusia_phi.AAC.1